MLSSHVIRGVIDAEHAVLVQPVVDDRDVVTILVRELTFIAIISKP